MTVGTRGDIVLSGNQMEKLAFGLELKKRGGAREGAGRPRSSRRMPHGSRAEFAGRFPLHVIWRMDPRVWNLRSRRAWKVLRPAFQMAADRFGGRLVEFAVLGNHVHLVVEAGGRETLGRAMRALGIRIARGLNRMMRGSGRVIADRYFFRILRTPRETRHAIQYVRNNQRKHATEWGETLGDGWRDPYASYFVTELRLATPRTWLLATALQRLAVAEAGAG